MSHCDQEKCKNCGASWREDRDIATFLFEEFRNKYRTREMAEETAEMYGWTPENQLSFGKDVVGVQYQHNHPQAYDGISEWQCCKCGARIGRWSGKVLADDESEKRFAPRVEESEEGRD
jgi:hypothetical protein